MAKDDSGRAASDLSAAIAADAREVARRTLRGKFGRLANFAILTRVRAVTGADGAAMPDAEMLERWFDAYDRAIAELRAGS
ncbi:MAG: hypothetical protein IAI48_17830 [Candidatus Eremiobacteraeota bacterium]|jgi:hypothetical protein|nr:hypothetical protein [Candidatus Eremiobacteraeota bacterium]